jgi:hypothetical protein
LCLLAEKLGQRSQRMISGAAFKVMRGGGGGCALKCRREAQRLAVKQQFLLHAVDDAAFLHKAVALALVQHVPVTAAPLSAQQQLLVCGVGVGAGTCT